MNTFASMSTHKKWIDEQVCSLSSNPPSRCAYELFDKKTKTPLRGSCNAFDQVYKDLCPPVDTSVPKPEYLPPGGNSPTLEGYCCGSWGSGGTCSTSWQNSWRRAFPGVIVPECDGKEEPGECEIVLVRDEVGWPHAACSVGEGHWIFPSITCWTGNDLTSEIRIGKNTKVSLCKHARDCSSGDKEYIRTKSNGPESVTFGGLTALRVECIKRRVTIWGNMHIKDDEVFKDEIFDRRISVTLDVDIGNPKSSTTVERRVGGEIRVEVTFTAVLQYDLAVVITAEQRLYEGVTTGTADLEDTDTDALCVREDTYEEIELFTENKGTFGGDYARTKLFIVNGDLDPQNKTVSVDGWLYVKDRILIGPDKAKKLDINESFDLTNTQRTYERQWNAGRGEVDGRLESYYLLLPDDSVVVDTFHRFYRSNDEKKKATWSKVIRVGAESLLFNKLERGGRLNDRSVVNITFSNDGLRKGL
jgi:hypothetical protein